MWQIRLLVTLFALLVFLLNAAADRFLMLEWHRPVRIIMFTDALAAVVIALLALKVMQYELERRRLLAQRVAMIAELNHHIRNALETIALSLYTAKDQKATEVIYAAVDRIDWALREILPSPEPPEARKDPPHRNSTATQQEKP